MIIGITDNRRKLITEKCINLFKKKISNKI